MSVCTFAEPCGGLRGGPSTQDLLGADPGGRAADSQGVQIQRELRPPAHPHWARKAEGEVGEGVRRRAAHLAGRCRRAGFSPKAWGCPPSLTLVAPVRKWVRLPRLTDLLPTGSLRRRDLPERKCSVHGRVEGRSESQSTHLSSSGLHVHTPGPPGTFPGPSPRGRLRARLSRKM